MKTAVQLTPFKTNNYLIKADIKKSRYRGFLWAIVLIVSIGGFKYPLLGLPMFPMFAVILGMGLIKGRYWCGNYCPRGSFWDYPVRKLSFFKKLPSFFRSLWFRFLIMGVFGWSIYTGFSTLAGNWGLLSFWEQVGMVGVGLCVKTTLLGLALGLFVSPRSWCTFCPMGTLQKLLYTAGRRLGINIDTDISVSVNHESLCHKCGKCERTCPMQLAPFREFAEHQYKGTDCIKCGTCTVHCPAGILSLNKQHHALQNALELEMAGKSAKDRKRVKAQVSEIKQLTTDVKEITFKTEAELFFKPGQFILVRLDGSSELFRAFSISSEVSDGKHFRVTVKEVQGGYGSEIIHHNFTVGQEVILEGPLGDELVLSPIYSKLVFIGGGIGITPFVPLVKEAILQGVKHIELIHGVTKKEDFIYAQYFTALSEKHNQFTYTQVANDPSFEGNNGFVTDMLHEKNVVGSGIYLCGPRPMVTAAEEKLNLLQVPNNNIHAESA